MGSTERIRRLKGYLAYLPAFTLAPASFFLIDSYTIFSPISLLLLLGIWLWFHRVPFAGIGICLGICLFIHLTLMSRSSPSPRSFYALAEIAEVQDPLGSHDPFYRLELNLRPAGAPRCLQARLPAPKRKVGEKLWVEVRSLRYGKLPIPYANILTPPLPPQEDRAFLPPLTPARAFYEGILHNRFLKRGEEFVEIRWILDAGLAHLLSISGIHIGFFLLFLQGISRLFIMMLPWRFLPRIPHTLLYYGRWGISLSLAYLYLQKIGLPPASVRALLWVLLPLLVVRILRVHLARDTFVILVILFVSALYPCSLPTLSFALSLTAMIYLFPLLWVKGTIKRLLLGAILPWLGTFPLLSGWTYVNLTAPLANLFGIPFFGLWIFPLAWGYELLKAIPFLGSLLWDLYSFGFYLLAHLCRILLNLTPAELPPLPSFFTADHILFLCALPLLAEGFYRRLRPLPQPL